MFLHKPVKQINTVEDLLAVVSIKLTSMEGRLLNTCIADPCINA